MIGVPIDSAGEAGGTELAPSRLRAAGIVETIRGRDGGDLPVSIRGTTRDPTSGVVAYRDVVDTTARIRDDLWRLVERDEWPVAIGGCCALLPGVLAALSYRHDRVGLAYVDGHLDLYDGTTSPTGEAADLPLAIAVGVGDPALAGSGSRRPLVAPRDVALLGPRDAEQARADGSLLPGDLGGLGFVAYADEITDAAAVGQAALEVLEPLFWVHFDVDVLSATAAGLDAATRPWWVLDGGLTAAATADLLRPLVTSDRCLGMSLACYDPSYDPRGDGARSIVAILADLFGRP